MCGIAGISGWKKGPEELERALLAMQKALGHRGPDDRGILLDPKARWGLVHTRLSILDLSPCGRQPMTSADGKWHLVFNGEIYNYQSFLPGLEKVGHRFRSSSDTEVLLETLAREGMRALPKLRGMFAFALLQAERGQVWLGRDTFGVKPLYSAIGPDGELIFASEIRAVLASGRVAREISAEGLDGYLRSGSLPRPLTLVRGVFQQRSGCWSQYGAGQAVPGTCLEVNFFRKVGFERDLASGTDRQPVKETRRALEDSLEAHFVSDVPVGLFLSGGIDSTALAALAHATGRRGLQSFSLGFREGNHDESALTRRIARRFGMDHHLLRVDAENGRELFEGYLEALDQPTVDGFNTYCVSKLAADKGSKVVLSGLGGDELFGGYRSFTSIPRIRQWCARRRLPRPIAAGLAAWPSSRLRRLVEILGEEPTFEQAFLGFRGNFTGRESAALARKIIGQSGKWDIRADFYEKDGEIDRVRFPTDADAVGYLELSRYMRHQLLKDSDVFSMTHGLELRVPLVDLGLFDAIHSLPSPIRYQPGKKLLTMAVPEIPDYVYQHPKRGFTLPLEKWVYGHWKDMFASTARNFSGNIMWPWARLWSLKTLTYWLKKHGFEAGG